jgi:quinolinate synthase
VEQIADARRRFPGVRVVVHPECQHAVVEAADENGSTEYIVKVIEESPAGTIWAVGTEVNLVKRLAREHPDKTIFCLDPIVCPCSTMYRIHPAYLAWVLEELAAGRVVNQVSVDGETARWAKVALERMLANKA